MTAPNAELAYATLDLVNAHRNRFEMEWWADGPDSTVTLAQLTTDDEACGTTACYAGWAVALRGYAATAGGRVLDAETGAVISTDIQRFAADLLGISHDTSEYLFYVHNDDIEDAVAEIFGPRPEPAPVDHDPQTARQIAWSALGMGHAMPAVDDDIPPNAGSAS